MRISQRADFQLMRLFRLQHVTCAAVVIAVLPALALAQSGSAPGAGQSLAGVAVLPFVNITGLSSEAWRCRKMRSGSRGSIGGRSSIRG